MTEKLSVIAKKMIEVKEIGVNVGVSETVINMINNTLEELAKEIQKMKMGIPKEDIHIAGVMLNRKDANLVVIGNNKALDKIAGGI